MATDTSGYAQNYADATHDAFQQQVQMALINYGATVATELTTVANHAVRVMHLGAILANQGSLQKYVQLYALLATSTAAGSAAYGTTTDAEMLTIVGNIWTALCTGSAPVF